MQTKIYVDGFWIDTIDLPLGEEDIESAALTSEVKDLIEGRTIQSIIPLPKVILITTVL